VAFGRPRLKTPRGRPPIDIPPLKRRRITYDAEEEDGEEEGEEEYRPMLITERGEDDDDPLTVAVSATFDDADDEGADEGDDMEFMDESDLEDELSGLEDELRDLQQDIAEHGEPADAGTPEKAHTSSPPPDNAIDLSVLSKITALRAAFPEADVGRCEKVLVRRKNSLKKAYKKLRKSYDPQMSRKEMRKYFKSLAAPAANFPLEIEEDAGDDDEDDAGEDESGAESVASIVKHYDQHGFPDGSILAGTASTHMAESLRKAGQFVKLPVHTKFDSDDDTSMGEPPAPKEDKFAQKSDSSSSGEDSDSSESGVDLGSNADKASKSDTSESSNDDAEETQQSESDSSDEESDRSPESGSESSDEGGGKALESDSESSSDDDDDSGPEVASSKPTGPRESDNGGDSDLSSGGAESDDDSSSSSIEEESDDEQASDKAQEEKSEEGGAPLANQASSDSSADSSSDSSLSESDDEEPSSEPKSGKGSTVLRSTPTAGKLHGRSEPTRTAPESSVSSLKPATLETGSASVPHGQGMSKTQMRNARRRAARKGKNAPGLSNTTSQISTGISLDVVQESATSIETSLAARKKALLSSLDLPVDQDDAMITTQKPASHSGANDSPAADSNATPSQSAAPKSPSQLQPEFGQDGASGTAVSSPQRRSKVDISAGRRMLFGALGIRNPKSKSDEDKIRADLMKGVRPLANSRLADRPDTAPVDGEDGNNQSVEDEPESWRSKITYRAVECCHDGVELSEPPFPFVQRWDPQQQFWSGKGGRRGGQGKRKQRDDHAFYDEDDNRHTTKKRKFRDELTEGWAGDGAMETDVGLNYDDKIPEEVPEQHGTEQSQFTDLDDLPSLPKDVSSLPELRQGQAAAGMVITWKQWLLSKATNWQPTVSNVTAIVVNAEDEAGGLRMVLAKRDRNLDRTEKSFDEDGNRIYDRFEAPDDDDDDVDEGAEDGYRTLQFSELMDPRILQQPLSTPQNPVLERIPESTGGDEILNSIESEVNDSNGDGSGRSGDKSTTLDHEGASNTEQADKQVDADIAESVIPETFPEGSAQQLDSVQIDIPTHSEVFSVSEDRRDEISLLISNAGFRKDISPSILKKVPFHSPSEQLREMSESAAVRDSRQTSESPSAALPAGTSTSSRHRLVAGKNGAELPSDMDTAPKAVAYPKLDVQPSPVSTTHSGRQPDADFGADWTAGSFNPLEDTADESMVLGNTPQNSRGGNGNWKKSRKSAMTSSPASAASVSSIGSLPSLSEIFSTARSSHNNGQSPSKAAVLSAIGARKSETIRDHDYEEMMRRLDEGDGQSNDENDSPVDEKKFAASTAGLNGDGKSKPTKRSVFQRRTRRQSKNTPSVEAAAEEDTSSLRSPSPISSFILPSEGAMAPKKEKDDGNPYSPPADRPRSPPSRPQTRRRAQQQSSSQFSIPSGSVVMSLMTSSPESAVIEHYAEDHIDETYEDPSPLPDGSGWVKKAAHGSMKGRVRGGGGGGRGASLPVAAANADNSSARKAAPRASVNNQDDIGVSPEPRRTRRKTSARF